MSNEQPPSPAEMPASAAPEQGESSPTFVDSRMLPDAEVQWLDGGMPLLKSFFAQEPNAHEDIQRILDEYLKAAPGEDTINQLVSSMQRYAGDAEGDFLVTILRRGMDDRKVFDYFVDKLEATDRSWARLMLALYGTRARDAWQVAGELPDDWMTLEQQVTYNAHAQKWMIKIRIMKYNGTTFFIEGRPGSYLTLIGLLLGTLRDLEPEAIRDSFDETRVTEVTSTCVDLLRIVTEQSLRQQLVDAILKVPKVEKLQLRTRWLAGIPQSQLARHAGNPADDIKGIVGQLDAMEPLTSGKRSGERALLVFIDNVLADASLESDVADEIKRMRGDFKDKYGWGDVEQLAET